LTALADRLAALRVPLVGAPMFLVSNPALVVAQCRAGVVGSVPSLNVRTVAEFDEWAARITRAWIQNSRTTLTGSLRLGP
jgi:nitronate monooxygenase